jgi:hypothetical protein
MFSRIAAFAKPKHLIRRAFFQLAWNRQPEHNQMTILLHQTQLEAAKKDAEVAKKDAEIAKKDSLLISTQLSFAKKESQLEKENLQKDVQILTKELNRTTAYMLHYAKQLTVRAIIERFEQSFGENLKKSKQGRQERWTAFLNAKSTAFDKISENGFSVESVADIVTMLYNSASAQLHSIEHIEGLGITVSGFNDDQIKLLHILIELTGWSGTVTLVTKLNENSQSKN